MQHLIFDYPGHRALDDVSFSIAAGSITALVGPNGAGKTTLLRCIAGLQCGTSGFVRIDQVDVADSPRDAHALLGFLSDFFGRYETLTVRQSLAYFGASYRIDQLQQRVEETLSLCRLTEQADTLASDLSRGYRQRLGIAQAIMHQPPVLLLDEPASGLDPEARAELAELLVTLKDNGTTVVVSSHILVELEAYSTHMLVLRDGRLVEMSPLGSVDNRINLAIGVTSNVEALRQSLSATPGFTIVEADDGVVIGEYDRADPASLAQLNQQLINDGHSVYRFTEIENNLQEQYLRLVTR